MGQIVYRTMTPGEEPMVCELVRQVFDECIAEEFGTEGAREFLRFASPSAMQDRGRVGGFVLLAVKSSMPLGMLEIAPRDRIALMFVLHRGQGIARELLAYAVGHARAANPSLSKLTVHSSLFAEPFYRKAGFRQTGEATTENGITYVPMELGLRNRRT